MKKYFSIGIFASLGLLVIFFWQTYRLNDSRLHVVFCNVGQGDAIFIRTPNKTDILVDGGPDRKVLECLSNHMPFWDRSLELVILSHPHQDHFAGLIDVLNSYNVKSFATEKLTNDSRGFAEFLAAVKEEKLALRYLLTGDSLKTTDGLRLSVISPSRSLLERSSPNGQIGESGEFGSLVLRLSFGEFSALLTSDSQAAHLVENVESIGNIDVLQVPHHGSRFGLDSDIVSQLSPSVGVISVGKNSYGHPSGEIIKILSEKDIKILRTDKNGEVEIISDGKTFQTQD